MARTAMLPQTVKEVLREARPDWTARELAAVQTKLERVGVFTIEALQDSLDEHIKGHINLLLQQHGLKTFTDQTLFALKAAFQGRHPRRIKETEDAEDADKAKLPPPRRLPEVVPVVAQRYNVTTDGERMISKSTTAGWGVVTFDAPADFVLAVQFERDAGALAEPWADYVLVGLVPGTVKAAQIAASDQPWDWGVWVAPCTSPLQVWSRMRTPHNPIQVPLLQEALRAGQTLHLKRNVQGIVGVSVDDGATVRLPASSVWRGSGVAMRPCVLLGLNTVAKVWITLFSDSRSGQGGEDSPEADVNHRVAGNDPQEAAAQDVAQQAECVAPQGACQAEQQAQRAGAEDDTQELRPVEVNREPSRANEESDDDDDDSSEEEPVESEDWDQDVCDNFPGPTMPTAPMILKAGPTTPKEERVKEIQRAKKSKKYSVGDLVGFFETKMGKV